jgi:hypothetical protein
MKKIVKTGFLPVLIFFAMLHAGAQTPFDDIMMEKGEICFAAIYTHDTWDEYWEGTLKRDNANIGTLTRQTVSGMFAFGIADWLNVMGSLPWVRTDASGGQMAGVSGLQDWGAWIKGEAFKFEAGSGQLSLHAVAGLTGPATNYLSDYQPFSLGLGCLDASLRGILHYQLDKGIYARLHTGYHHRGHSTIERDYYYTTHGVYSDKVDMPNAITYGATLGAWMLGNSLRIEATYDGVNCLSGHDIRRQDMPFPSNKMVFTRIGGMVQYYFPTLKGLGLQASGGYVLTGRNVGQSTVLSGGVLYRFHIWK